MKHLIFILLISFGAIAQKQRITGDVGQKIDLSYQKNWIYFKLTDTIEVKIIKHFPANFHCGTATSASLTIVKTKKGEIIRLLNICNLRNYNKNRIVKIISGIEPSKVSLPFTQVKNKQTQLYEPSEFDSNILKTAWVSFLER
jgi:hypothetical protein